MSRKRWIYAVRFDGEYAGAVSTYWYANKAFTPGGAHTLAELRNRTVRARVRGFPWVSVSLFGRGRTRGGIDIDDGGFELINRDGALDGLMARAVDSRSCSFWRFNEDNLEDYALIYLGVCAGRPDVNAGLVSFKVRGQQYLLDKAMLTTKYAGTNAGGVGLEGNADDIKGKVKPWAEGKRFNVVPVLVNDVKYIYQLDAYVGARNGYAVTMMDQRVVIPYDAPANYAAEADLNNDALAPVAGKTKLFPGNDRVLFRLGSKPLGTVSCDFTLPGPAPTISTKDLILDIAQRNGLSVIGVAFTTPTNGDAGIYLNAETTALQALEPLLASMMLGMFFPVPPAPPGGGPIWVGFGQADTAGAVKRLYLHQGNVFRNSVELLAPQDSDQGVPIWRYLINYRENAQVMGPNDVGAGVSFADLAALGQQWRTTIFEDPLVLNRYPNSPELVLDTPLYDAVPAQVVGQAFTARYHAENLVLSLRVHAQVFDDFLLDPAGGIFRGVVFPQSTAINLTWPRWGLNNGLDCALIAYERLKDREQVQLTLFSAVPAWPPLVAT